MTNGPVWYALRVVPQKEYTVAWMLERQAVWAIVPTNTYQRRRTRYAKGKIDYAKPALHGCVFARFEEEPAWYDLLRNHLILGAIGHGGVPWRLQADDVLRFEAHAPNGTMVLRDGERLIHHRGKLLRSTSQARIISARKRAAVLEPTAQEAAILAPMVIPPEAVLLAA